MFINYFSIENVYLHYALFLHRPKQGFTIYIPCNTLHSVFCSLISLLSYNSKQQNAFVFVRLLCDVSVYNFFKYSGVHYNRKY